jgi:cohesin domain-containing protein
MALLGAASFAKLVLPAAAHAGTAPQSDNRCGGDCGGDGAVTLGELIALVNIVLGHAQPDSCRAANVNSDSRVDISDVVGAVRNSLSECLPSLLIGRAAGNPGDAVTIPVELTANGHEVLSIAALSFEFDSAALSFAECVSLVPGKNAVATPSAGRVALALSGDLNALPNGAVLNCRLTIRDTTQAGTYPVHFASVALLDAAATILGGIGTDGAVSVAQAPATETPTRGVETSPTSIDTPTLTPASTATDTPAESGTPTPTVTPTSTEPPTESPTPTQTFTSSSIPTPTSTPTNTPVVPPPLVLIGTCFVPGPNGLVACALGTRVTAARCNDPVRCIRDPQASTPLGLDTTDAAGMFRIAVPAATDVATVVLQADVAQAVVYRSIEIIDFGSAGTGTGSRTAAATRTDIVIDPSSEGGVRGVDTSGLAVNQYGPCVIQLTRSQSNDGSVYAGKSAGKAADVAQGIAQTTLAHVCSGAALILPSSDFALGSVVRVRLSLISVSSSAACFGAFRFKLDCPQDPDTACGDGGPLVRYLGDQTITTTCPAMWTSGHPIDVQPNQVNFSAQPPIGFAPGQSCALEFDVELVALPDSGTTLRQSLEADMLCFSGLTASAFGTSVSSILPTSTPTLVDTATPTATP